jgi:hypothetical protein
MREALGGALRDVVLFAPTLVAFLVILVVGYLIAKLIGTAIDTVLERVRQAPGAAQQARQARERDGHQDLTTSPQGGTTPAYAGERTQPFDQATGATRVGETGRA